MRLSQELERKCLRLATKTIPGRARRTKPTTSANPSRRKYRNQPVEQDGIKFDSRKEARRWGELQLLESLGEISDLQRQVRIPIRVNGVAVCRYVADAVYVENGTRVIEDTKSPITRRNPVYRLKRKLLQAAHGITIREA